MRDQDPVQPSDTLAFQERKKLKGARLVFACAAAIDEEGVTLLRLYYDPVALAHIQAGNAKPPDRMISQDQNTRENEACGCKPAKPSFSGMLPGIVIRKMPVCIQNEGQQDPVIQQDLPDCRSAACPGTPGKLRHPSAQPLIYSENHPARQDQDPAAVSAKVRRRGAHQSRGRSCGKYDSGRRDHNQVQQDPGQGYLSVKVQGNRKCHKDDGQRTAYRDQKPVHGS